jgi:EAL domain-containing protein (putative c-di-GMP-specific phosphodiesterase class I)
MAHSLKLKVIAEGVETEQHLEWLHARDCDEVQGFHFSRPVPAEAAGLLLAKSKTRNN